MVNCICVVWGLYEFTRAPFGQKGSDNTFMRAMQNVLHPIRKFTASFVDDIAVYSTEFEKHVSELE